MKKLLHQRPRSDKSKSDEWALPKEDFDRIAKEYYMYPLVDVCATELNTKCPFYMDEQINALETSWLLDNCISLRPEYLQFCEDRTATRYINPPNSLTQKFIERASLQNSAYGFPIIMVIPINATVTKRGKEFIWDDPLVEIYPLLPTPKFIYNGVQEDSARNRYCTVIWRQLDG